VRNLRKFVSGFGHAGNGIRYAIRTQMNIRVHLGITVAVLLLGLYLRLSRLEMMILVLTIMIVLAAEMFNTAIETVVDLISPEYHPLAKIAKDVAAGAVLVCAVGAVAVGILIFVSV